MQPEPQPPATKRLQTADATPEHIADFVAQGPRPADAEEWRLATGSPLTLDSFKSAIGNAPAHATLDVDGRCVCLWGAIPDAMSAKLGNFWPITADVADHSPAAITAEAQGRINSAPKPSALGLVAGLGSSALSGYNTFKRMQ